MKKIIKRNGKIVDFDSNRIINAITMSMYDSTGNVDQRLAFEIAKEIEVEVPEQSTVEQIQDMVQLKLMNSDRKDVAVAYITKRQEKDRERLTPKKEGQLLTDEFISQYKHKVPPLNELGMFVYYRTYSRWLPEYGRREYWYETVRRAVEYNCSLAPTTRQEAEKLYDNIYNLRQFLSGRTFWVGGTEVAKDHPMGNYNCAFIVIDEFEALKDLFYALMIGTGVGFRVLKSDVAKMPKVRTDVEVIHKDYQPIPKALREDCTSLEFNGEMVKITVGDSKEGWTQALDFYFKILYNREYRSVSTVIIDYDNVRPKGERLKRFGGTASGHESLKNMFTKIDKVVKNRGLKDNSAYTSVKPIDAMDFCNIIGENVVVGGVRRTAEIALIDTDDQECITAKSGMYHQDENGNWKEDKDILHRRMSNNSIIYYHKPTREQLHWQMETMRWSGEPAFINAESAMKRRPNFNGLNPCAEILLDSRGLCNLTTVNALSFVKNGKLDVLALLEAQKLSARAGYRMTCVTLELYKWDIVQKRDRLIGTSISGWQDMKDAVGMTEKEEIALLKTMREVVHDEAEKMAKQLGGNVPLLCTTVKPEGTLSQVAGGISSGLHYSHSPYYIRRIRINANDPLVKVCEDLGYPVFPETGQEWETCNTKVVEFPMATPAKKTKYDVSAIEQLENYKRFQKYYTDHNSSITVTVKADEWDAVEQWIWDNWDDMVATSFLSLDDNYYPLLPYEAIDEAEYKRRKEAMKPFIPSLLRKYEKQEVELDIGNDGCESGICPIR